ncbi:MAG: FAD-dependent oxidoreductase [Nitrososphaerota archaeon]|nr:FAD-dependent oxidoreductase [Nitrososphaerota archaeon]
MPPFNAPKFDVAIVGAGPAGASAAYTLAKNGFKVVVIERGRTPGSKNLFGGRVYSRPLELIFEGFRNESPVERWVNREVLSFVTEKGMVSFEYASGSSTSFTAYLSKLSAWMTSKAESVGAIVVTDVRVDGVLMENGRAVGVVSGGDRLYADVVVIAEGINRLLCESMNIVPQLSPEEVALGVKYVIRLGTDKINERFGLDSNEGLAWFLVGKVTDYLPGGAFLYTNSATVSLGVVLFLSHAMKKLKRHVHEVLEDLRTFPPFARLLEGGSLVEYGAHLTPEVGPKVIPKKLYGDGFLIVGDAAGLLINLGYTVRGVDLAAFSGYLAAEAIKEAHSLGSYTSNNLSCYERKLNESFVMREIRKHKSIQKLMNKNYAFELYPQVLVDTTRRLFEIEETSPKLLEAINESLKDKGSKFRMFLDIIALMRGP